MIITFIVTNLPNRRKYKIISLGDFFVQYQLSQKQGIKISDIVILLL